MNEVNFNNKVFVLQNNTANGTSTADTLFYYKQEGSLVTAEFKGGTVQYGNIVAKLNVNYLDMRYQLLTTHGELKSGRAIAFITLVEGKIQLKLDWEWLTGSGEKGNSTYLEQS